jgi:hypothetical protein
MESKDGMSELWNKFYNQYGIEKKDYGLKEQVLLNNFKIDPFCKEIYRKISKYGGLKKGLNYLEGRLFDQLKNISEDFSLKEFDRTKEPDYKNS